jgi:uncharacterized protein (DUF302 family)
MIRLPVVDSVAAATKRLEAAIGARGLQVFARIDFAADAAAAGLPMPPALLFLFGQPRAGTPLMVAAPTLALDLPLKILIYEDRSGAIWVGYNSPEFLAERHQVPRDLLPNIAGVRRLASIAAGTT